MAPKLKYNVKGVDRGFVVVDPGLYRAKVLDVKLEESSKGDPMLVVHFAIKGGKFDGSKMRTWITLTERSEWKLAEFVDAVDGPETGDINKLIKAPKGKIVQFKVDPDEYEGKPTARVGTIMPVGDEDEEEEDLEEDEDDDVEEDDDESDDDEEDEEDDDEDESDEDEDESDEDDDDDDDEEDDVDDEDAEDDEEDDEDEDDEEEDEDDDEAVDYSTLKLDDLKDLAKQRGIKPTVKRKGELLKGAALKKALIAKLEKADDPFSE